MSDGATDPEWARERLETLRRRWPPGLVELHAELTAVEVLRRVEDLVDRTGESVEVRPLCDEALEWTAGGAEAFEAAFFEGSVDEKAAARNLLWTAADWLEPDDVLMLGRAAGRLGPHSGTGPVR